MARTVHLIFAICLAISMALLSGCTDADVKKARRYQKEGDYEQAIQYYKTALEKDPENRSVRYSLIETYVLQLMESPKEQITTEMVEKTMLEARPAAQPLMDDANIKRYISMIYQLMANRYAEEEMDEKVAESWAEVTKIEPSNAEGHYNLGVALTKQEKYEEALPHLEKSTYLNPYFIKGYYAIGNTLVTLGRPEEAKENYLKALEINPDDAEIRHNLGIVYSQTGQTEKAIEELEKAIDLEPGFFMAYRSLTMIYKNMGNTQKTQEVDKRWAEYAEAHIKSTEENEQQAESVGDSG